MDALLIDNISLQAFISAISNRINYLLVTNYDNFRKNIKSI